MSSSTRLGVPMPSLDGPYALTAVVSVVEARRCVDYTTVERPE